MLSFTGLALYRGSRCLFRSASATLHPGQKVGLTGRNGTGKSSLLALIRGELQADEGHCEVTAGTRIAHVAQETPALPRKAIDYVLDGDTVLRRIERQIEAAESGGDGARLAQLHHDYEIHDGYTANARAAHLMHGLGFADSDLQRPVSQFSGGWRMRLNLARALISPSDLLLLDEPTNHLDLDAVIWLERWLAGYRGTLLLISHDRDFLDNVVESVLHIENQTLTLYRGNYSAFEEQRAARLQQQQALYERQQREIAHIRAFVDRFRAKATKARQAQSRLRALERMERIEAAHADMPFDFRIESGESLPSPLLRLEAVSVGYAANRPILEEIHLILEPGSRLALLGYNGAGKSTLVKLLAGALEPGAGEIIAAKTLKIGYFAQHQLEQLDTDASPLLLLQRLAPGEREQRLRDYLGGYDFRGDRADAPCGTFSGGEKARLVLALIAWQAPNLLLLDEPTNHLDIEMRFALNRALQEYPGAVVLVSHDRHLLRSTSDEFMLVHDGRVSRFAGDLDDYRSWLEEQARESGEDRKGVQAREHSAEERKRQRRKAAEQRQRRQPLVKRIAAIEAELETLQAEQRALETRLANGDLYSEDRKEELKALLLRQSELGKSCTECEQRWLELHGELEALDLELQGGKSTQESY
ncbi:MAG: ABC transporter ATP-binding protein [Gammaproteobacteria bacterium]